jgi:serine/threonine-protein kinase RsbW
MQSQDNAYAYYDAPPTALPLAGWKRWEIHALAEVTPIIRQLEVEMKALEYPRKDSFAIGLVLREVVSNAIRHGHRGDASRPVMIHSCVGIDLVLLEVVDEGRGFDPHAIPNPLMESREGRFPPRWGLLLMRLYTSWIRFNKRGNRVLLCKRHSAK